MSARRLRRRGMKAFYCHHFVLPLPPEVEDIVDIHFAAVSIAARHRAVRMQPA